MRNPQSKIYLMISTVVATVALFVFAIPVSASTTDGTIDTTEKYAWSSKVGWVNFGATNGNIHITNTAVTGNAWNDLYGWILMNPTQSGVKNDGNGTLSGSAWSTNLGWLDFTGVTIDSNGNFAGQATGDNFGTVNFSCAYCGVKTDWRPASSLTECNNGIDDDSDEKTDYPEDPGCSSLTDDNETDEGGGGPKPPEGGFEPGPSYFIILNNDYPYTASRNVSVTLRCGDALYAWVSEDSNFVSSDMTKMDCDTASIYTQGLFNLSAGEGLKTVYAKFCNFWGQCSHHRHDSIIYSLTPPTMPEYPTTTPPGEEEEEQPPSVIESIKEYLKSLLAEVVPPKIDVSNLPLAKLFTEKWLPKLKSLVPYFAKGTELEKMVSRRAPLAMRGDYPWELLDPRPTKKFVFAPLPKEFLALTNKLPEVKNTFDEVGIYRMTNLNKMLAVKMNLPGLSQVLGLKPTSTAGLAGLPPFKVTPIAKLSKDLKEKIPTGIIFTRGANELVDFKVVLTLSETGRAVQKITAIAGKPLELSVKPDSPVDDVTGYVTFKSRNQTMSAAPASVPLASVVNSLFNSQSAVASQTSKPAPKAKTNANENTEFVLEKFSYNDIDGDGIYTASINAPIPTGEYEIITVMDYQNPDLGMKEVRLVTVIDPEGYVFAKINDQELRIRDAIVSLYWLNTKEKRYELWPATDYQQDNPQITDSRGTYSFLVPQGTYYIAAEAPGYMTYEGKPFKVEEGGGIHLNVQIKNRYWFLAIIDWRTLLLIVIGLSLLYNFYHDKKKIKTEIKW